MPRLMDANRVINPAGTHRHGRGRSAVSADTSRAVGRKYPRICGGTRRS
ncbi:MAG: hypothetical protein FWF18_01025 [Dehalococcoidia bacterium]|nr:hypothetical protein [Dehalococcoidia bacterium]